MSNRAHRFSLNCIVPSLALLAPLLIADSLLAQGSRRQPSPPANAKALDQQADKVMNDYLGGLADLSTKYEEVGDTQKASEMLKAILKIKPDADVVKSRLKQLEEAVFTDNVYSIDVDAGAGWVPAGVLVTKDKPVRVEADGTFKVTLNETLGAGGLPSNDVMREAVKDVPLGALMAIVVKSDTGNRKGPGKDGPKPIEVGAKKEFNPPESGNLFLKVNLPESAKATGKVKVKITGNMLPIR